LKRILVIDEAGATSLLPQSLTKDYEVDMARGSVDALGGCASGPTTCSSQASGRTSMKISRCLKSRAGSAPL
jgi:hypothetical protein